MEAVIRLERPVLHWNGISTPMHRAITCPGRYIIPLTCQHVANEDTLRPGGEVQWQGNSQVSVRIYLGLPSVAVEILSRSALNDW